MARPAGWRRIPWKRPRVRSGRPADPRRIVIDPSCHTPVVLPRRRLVTATAAALGVAVGLLSGCASQTATLRARPDPRLPRRIELDRTPFVPQAQRFLCAPEALTMVMQAAGAKITLDELAPAFEQRGGQGAMQPEMLATPRRHGLLSHLLPPDLGELLREVSDGTPAVVLLNLAVSLSPAWHHAVLIGHDLDREEVILRSGREARRVMPMAAFEQAWVRSDQWAMVVLPPWRLPLTPSEAEVTRSAVAFERVAEPSQAVQAYRAALARWPASLTLAMGLGNSLHASGRREDAAEVFLQAARRHRSAAAWVNYGTVALELGRPAEAESAAAQALDLGGAWNERARALQRRAIELRSR